MLDVIQHIKLLILFMCRASKPLPELIKASFFIKFLHAIAHACHEYF